MSPRGKRNPDTPFLSTTEISPEKTAGEISELLARAGAKHVMMEYGDQREIVSIAFSIIIQEKEVLFRLPVRWKQFLEVQREAFREKGMKGAPPSEEQARRMAWRVILRWLEAQLALIKTEMVRIEEVMLPYVVQSGGHQTLYERLAQTGFLLEHK